jgi:DNA mismatch repair protein MutS
MQGVADGSFGIEVAKLANLPEEVICKAQEHLKTLTDHEQAHAHQYVPAMPIYEDRLIEENRVLKEKIASLHKQATILSELQNLSLDELTPKQAFDLLWQWKEEQT